MGLDPVHAAPFEPKAHKARLTSHRKDFSKAVAKPATMDLPKDAEDLFEEPMKNRLDRLDPSSPPEIRSRRSGFLAFGRAPLKQNMVVRKKEEEQNHATI